MSAERRALREPVSLETSLSFAYLVIIGYDGAFQGYSVSAEVFIAIVAHNEFKTHQAKANFFLQCMPIFSRKKMQI